MNEFHFLLQTETQSEQIPLKNGTNRLTQSRVATNLFHFVKNTTSDFLGGPVVTNPPCNAGNMGLIPSPERFHTLLWQLSRCAILPADVPYSLSHLLLETMGTFLVVQWLRLHIPSARNLSSIPGWGTRSHMPQLRVCIAQLKIPHAATKAQHRQINKY